jgi:sugar lactone lactonase YvrE
MAVVLARDVRAAVGEGLLWDAEERALFWVDIPRGRLHRFDPETGAARHWDLGEPVGCAFLRRAGGMVVALRSGLALFDLETGAATPLLAPEPDRPANRPNDGTIDPRGRLWLGTMKTDPPAEPTGAFYRIDPDRSWRRLLDGFYTTNGLAFAPDGRTLYLSDSHPSVRRIWAFDHDPATGAIANRRLFFDTRAVAGRPDGATVDAEGCYWMAGVGGWQLVRLTPQGRVDRIVPLPVERPSRPAFGGPRLDVLYVTSIGIGLAPGSEPRQPWAGALLAVHGLGVCGLPMPRFAG